MAVRSNFEPEAYNCESEGLSKEIVGALDALWGTITIYRSELTKVLDISLSTASTEML